MKKLNFSPSKDSSLVQMLLTGEILQRLESDFPRAQVQDPADYIAYIEENFRLYPGNTFALCNGYKLEIICIGMLTVESLISASYSHLTLNDNLGFRLVNTRGVRIEEVISYEDIVCKLRGSE